MATPRHRPGSRNISDSSRRRTPSFEARGITNTSNSPSMGEAVGVSVRKPRYVSTLATVTSTASSATLTPSTVT
jgi:hypothetical protein